MDIDGFRALAERPRDAENPSRSTRPPHAHRLQTTLTCKAKLRPHPATGNQRGRRRKAADELLHYVAKRSETICYPEFLAKGWQIGSGPTEAMCKTTTARLKGSGMRWDGVNAEAVMSLAA